MSVKIPKRPIGKAGLEVSAQGLGIMSFGNSYGDTRHVPTEAENQEVLRKAAELGVTFIDSADVYGRGESERQLGLTLKDHRSEYEVATKFGLKFNPEARVMGFEGVSGTPEFIRHQIEDSLKRLNTDHIDLYYQHRVDRTIPIEETWKELKKLVSEGKVKYLGISEATPEEIRKAHAIHPVTAMQLEWSLWTRNAEKDLIPVLRELGIGIVPYSPLGRGFLTGSIAEIADLNEDDRRRNMPRFKEGNFEKNVELVAELKKAAAKKGVTAGQLALAWVHAQGDDVFPIPGTKQPKYLEENAAAFFVKLTKDEVEYLSDIFSPEAVQGSRFGKEQQALAYEYQNPLISLQA